MAEPVDRIRAKVTRAKQHIEDFQLALKAFYDTKPYPILVKEDTEAGQRVYYLGEVAEVPMNVETIAADVLANLRSVPDQIAYRLEILGGAKPDDRIYFPIAESAAKYPAMRDRYIKRAGQAAIDAIDATEPYKGGKGNWLWQLNTLHKVDKHRLLVAAGSYYVGVDIGHMMTRHMQAVTAWPVLDMSVVIAPADKLLPLKKGDELFREPLDMEVDEQLPFALSVSLNQPGVIDAEPALKSLVELTNATDALLTSFEPLLA